MPQLDLVAFLSQYVWVLVSVGLLYMVLVRQYLPRFHRILSFRSKFSGLSEKELFSPSNWYTQLLFWGKTQLTQTGGGTGVFQDFPTLTKKVTVQKVRAPYAAEMIGALGGFYRKEQHMSQNIMTRAFVTYSQLACAHAWEKMAALKQQRLQQRAGSVATKGRKKAPMRIKVCIEHKPSRSMKKARLSLAPVLSVKTLSTPADAFTSLAVLS